MSKPYSRTPTLVYRAWSVIERLDGAEFTAARHPFYSPPPEIIFEYLGFTLALWGTGR